MTGKPRKGETYKAFIERLTDEGRIQEYRDRRRAAQNRYLAAHPEAARKQRESVNRASREYHRLRRADPVRGEELRRQERERNADPAQREARRAAGKAHRERASQDPAWVARRRAINAASRARLLADPERHAAELARRRAAYQARKAQPKVAPAAAEGQP